MRSTALLGDVQICARKRAFVWLRMQPDVCDSACSFRQHASWTPLDSPCQSALAEDVAFMTDITRERMLETFLLSHFSVDEFRYLVEGDKELSECGPWLPHNPATRAAFFTEAVQVLGRRGKIARKFFASLTSVRPQLKEAIRDLSVRWAPTDDAVERVAEQMWRELPRYSQILHASSPEVSELVIAALLERMRVHKRQYHFSLHIGDATEQSMGALCGAAMGTFFQSCRAMWSSVKSAESLPGCIGFDIEEVSRQKLVESEMESLMLQMRELAERMYPVWKACALKPMRFLLWIKNAERCGDSQWARFHRRFAGQHYRHFYGSADLDRRYVDAGIFIPSYFGSPVVFVPHMPCSYSNGAYREFRLGVTEDDVLSLRAQIDGGMY